MAIHLFNDQPHIQHLYDLSPPTGSPMARAEEFNKHRSSKNETKNWNCSDQR